MADRPRSPIADRMRRIPTSQTIAVIEKARALSAAGRDILNLSAGEPDFETPENIKAAAIKAIHDGQTRYTDVAGVSVLREAVTAKFKRDNNLVYAPGEVIVGTGGKQIIFNALLATINAGDEAIIPTPCWVSYPDIVSLADGIPVIVPCSDAHNFKLQPDALESAITSRTKWLILNTPSNPSGALYSREELSALATVLRRHPNIWILTDDIYEKLVFDGLPFSTMAQAAPDLRDRTLTMNGCSKGYAMTGWRIGFGAGPKELISEMVKLQSQSTSNTCSIAQAAAVEALSGPQDSIAKMVTSFQERRDLVVRLLTSIQGLTCGTPQGAFYVFPGIRHFIGKRTAGGTDIVDDEAFVTALLAEEGVAAVHGAAFKYPGHIRISYSTSVTQLEDACKRIHRFCSSLH
ncbi:pyridoxal phosphate-dependent aminotransferase [Bradyrhizobium sp. 188]|uniref:pyridoxal phosphate-dependent aminotransferase n=1 Tax=Bradyrhizobium sp. 188 TaxID=2782656 RepID=UPI001FFA5741|nr:pyridoxal phosphate-dependent aminotransferase [Bradyrhizobium sp. 188]MCK1503346.1 pyridoxal phosphate-dependent aminotransferase [Bradyrhizobium sp. 188]